MIRLSTLIGPSLLAAALIVGPASPAAGQQVPPRPQAAPGVDVAADVAREHGAVDPLHAALDALLRRHVHGPTVDYVGLASERAGLQAYLSSLADVDPGDLSRAQTLALWINAYNAATLELILDHYGRIDSIKDIPSGKRWKAERWRVAGRVVSLDAMEHEILRPLGEPRIHFAINCASRSCPDLRAEAYTASQLDAQLQDAAQRFLADDGKGLTVKTESTWLGGTDHNVYVSKIFDWFEEDFERAAGDVVAYVLPLAPGPERAYLRRHRDDLDVESLDYDWSLNDVTRPRRR